MSIRKDKRYGIAYKLIEVRIIVDAQLLPPSGKRITHRIHAKAGKWFTPAHASNVLQQEAELLARELPQFDFRPVRLGPNKFNLIAEAR